MAVNSSPWGEGRALTFFGRLSLLFAVEFAFNRSVSEEIIQSRQNPRIQAVARLRDRPERETRGLFIAEGLRELGRAFEKKIKIEEVYFCPEMFRGSEAAEWPVAETPRCRAQAPPSRWLQGFRDRQ